MASEAELTALLREVLKAPVNHTGARMSPWRGDDVERHVIRYTAKRLPNELLDRIRAAVA